jgi:glycosyltransferase involved in cell wall biosynthesis
MNPRVVKEADALHNAGYEVRVVSCQWMKWQRNEDAKLLETRGWQNQVLDFSRDQAPWLFWYSRLRHHGARRLARIVPTDLIVNWAIGRLVPEMARLAADVPTDLFIGHNIAGLPAAVLASQKQSAIAFDDEDYNSGMWPLEKVPDFDAQLADRVLRKFLHQCSYITASSPGIGRALAKRYGVRIAETVLNVFPLSDRICSFRVHDPARPMRLYWFSQVIGARRGLEDVVAAMGLLRHDNIELHLRGVWQAGYRDALLAFAQGSGVAERQIIWHELASPSEMVCRAAEFDIGLALEPGRDENNSLALSNKIFIYLLAGNAVIASATEGQSEFAREIPEAIALYPARNPAALADIINRWLQDRDQLEAARQAAWRSGEKQYNWEIEQKKLITAVREAVSVPFSG